MPCAASPPSAFCQEKVTTSSLLQSSFCANAADVASQIVRPWRSALIQSALGTRAPEVVPFQVNTTSEFASTLARSGNWPYGAFITVTSLSLSSFWTSLTQRSEEHTSELQSRFDLVCRLLLEKKKNTY